MHLKQTLLTFSSENCYTQREKKDFLAVEISGPDYKIK